MRSRYRPWMSGVRAKHYLHRRITNEPRAAIYRIYIYNYARPLSVLTIAQNIFICSSAIFLTRGRLMITSAGKTSLFAVARGNNATREELRSGRMTRLFTIHINRVDRCRSGGEKSGRHGYARGGPLRLACNAYVVTAMCHSRRAGGRAGGRRAGLKRASWIFIRGYCKINVSTEEPGGERAAKRNGGGGRRGGESRNPAATSTFFPMNSSRCIAPALVTISTRGLKFHPILPPRPSMTRRCCADTFPAHFPESSDIYFRRPETPFRYLSLGLGNPVRFHTFSFPCEKFGRDDNRPNKVRSPAGRRTLERVSTSRIVSRNDVRR